MVFGGIIDYTAAINFYPKGRIEIVMLGDNIDPFKTWKLGDSIAVNGVCLTIVKILDDGRTFQFDLSQETIYRTTFKTHDYTRVHVEPALKLSDVVGGHVVSGHVHGVGSMKSLDAKTGDLLIVLPKSEFPHRPIFKDSIAIDGVSLTVAEIFPELDTIKISLIPHTIEKTLFKDKKPGDPVNIEINMASLAAATGERGAVSAEAVREAVKEMPIKDDEYWMKEAIVEGEKGRFTAPPNPWVGAILVDLWGQNVDAGHHVRPGEKHAERHITADMASCTLYVTLEPCSHYGRSPPCVDYIIEKKPGRVVVGTLDPDERVSGRGVQRLKEAGISVTVGIAEKEVKYSLRAYLWHRSHSNTPYVVCKLALSQDNCFAYVGATVEERKWITGVEARTHCHKLRAESQGVVVGKHTALVDKPQLNVRYGYEKLVDRQPQGIVSTRDLDWCRPGNPDMLQVLVEGGPELHNEILRLGIAQEFILYRSTKILGLTGLRWVPSFGREDWKLVETRTFEDGDTMQRFIQTKPTIPAKRIMKTPQEVINEAEANAKSFRDHEAATVKFDSLDVALKALKDGEMIIVMDDEDRENEGDLMILADRVNMRNMKVMLSNTTGIVCATMTKTRAQQLKLPVMVEHNTDHHHTNFTVTCDAAKGITTGVSAADRIRSLGALADPKSSAHDLVRPGHIFPLIARAGGLIERRGHTEAGVELARMAGMEVPVMVISELYDHTTGKMMSRSQCRQLGLPMITIDTILDYKGQGAMWARLPLQHVPGDWHLATIAGTRILQCRRRDGDEEAEEEEKKDKEANPEQKETTTTTTTTTTTRKKTLLLRVHSDCFTGDVLGSALCDCGNQLHGAMNTISKNPSGGMIIFPANHEGRGIGLEEKLRAYILQGEYELNTFQANTALGHPSDARSYEEVLFALKYMEILPDTHQIELITENPQKAATLKDVGYAVIVRDPENSSSPIAQKYLNDKRADFAAKSTATNNC